MKYKHTLIYKLPRELLCYTNTTEKKLAYCTDVVMKVKALKDSVIRIDISETGREKFLFLHPGKSSMYFFNGTKSKML